MEIKSSNVIARFGVCAAAATLSRKIAKEIVQTRFKRKARPPGLIRPNVTDKPAKKLDVLIFAGDFKAEKERRTLDAERSVCVTHDANHTVSPAMRYTLPIGKLCSKGSRSWQTPYSFIVFISPLRSRSTTSFLNSRWGSLSSSSS
jgi:hypothetical protein